MRVLLINQPWICNNLEYGLRAGVRWPQIRRRDRSMPYYAFPFSLSYATSFLLSNGIDADLRDSITLEETRDQALEHISRTGYDIVVLETSTPSIAYDLDFCDSIKECSPQTVVCLSGQHSTSMPEEVLRASRADYVLIGEYEKSLLNLSRAIVAGEQTDHLKGIAFRSRDSIINNGREELISFDELPVPFRDMTYFAKYNEPSARYSQNAPMMTSRGCSHKCTFCVEASANYGPQSNFRYRSKENVAKEIKLLVEDYGVKEIFFDDSFFTSKRANEIAQTILDNRFTLRWSCWIDLNTSEAILEKMKASGCSGVKFGVETFDEAIGRGIKKRVDPLIVRQLIDRCRRVGLLTHASYIFGLPGENRRTLKHTLSTAISLNTTSCQFSLATPIPGTELFEQAKMNNWLSTFDWSRYEGQASSVLKYDDLSENDLLNAMTRARKMKILRLLRNPAELLIFIVKLIRIMGVKGFIYDAFRKARFIVTRQ